MNKDFDEFITIELPDYAISIAKSEVLKRVILLIVNRELNSGAGYVSRPVAEDLQYIYQIDISDITGKKTIISLQNKHLKDADFTEEELYAAAYKNTIEKYPSKIRVLGEFHKCDLLGDGFIKNPSENMYIISNAFFQYGASTILYPEVADELNKLLGEYILIPFSIHGWIACKPQDKRTQDFNSKIKEFYYSKLDPSEWLSKHIYKFDEEGNLVSVYEKG